MLTAAPPTDTVVQPNTRFPSGLAIVIFVAACRLLLYLLAADHYGYSRDELYYLACGEHPAWGYVDQPPLIGWLAWLLQHTLGTGLYALRLFPALAGSGTIILTGLLTREFGGDRWAMFIASAAALLGPVFLGISHVFTMNAFDYPLWALLALLLIRIAKTSNERLWVPLGVVLGITLLNKYGIVFLGAGLLLGILISPMRRSLTRGWFWLGMTIALLIAIPNFLWQMNAGYPFLQLMRNVRASGRDIALAPLAYLADQSLLIGWAAAVLVPLAIVFFLGRGKRYAFIAVGFIFMLGTMLVLHGKGPYVTPAYPMMFAAGATLFEHLTNKMSLRWMRPAYALVLVGLGLLAAPLAFPILSPETFIRYTQRLGIEQPHYENQPRGRLPQFYADMFGWEERVEIVAHYYQALPTEERARTAVLAFNYGDAGAIDLFGPNYGLPKAISTHQNYWNWGPREYTGESLILVGGINRQQYESSCQSLVVVGKPSNVYARPDANRTIYHCRGFKQNLQDAWTSMRQLG